MTALVDRAREFAREKHATQLRRYTGEPYFVHLEEVAALVEKAGLSQEAIAAAWLHDSVEDQGVTMATIFRDFGVIVAHMVEAVTDVPPTPGMNRDQRKALDRQRLARACSESQGIKCADLISNTSTIVKYDPGFARKYLPEKRAILDVLTSAPPLLRDLALVSLQNAERDLTAITQQLKQEG